MVLPNCVELSAFAPGPKPLALLTRYGLQNKTVLMTMGRLASSERYKGFDEVLEILPTLSKRIPNLAYLIVGDGPDRARLVNKACSLGLHVWEASIGRKDQAKEPRPEVIFARRISDEEKADHYRLADVYVMPSSGEGFGIVLLEALACGIPVIGSKADGSREALLDGKLGKLVDPRNPAETIEAVLGVLASRNQARSVPQLSGDDTVEYFSSHRFERRVHDILDTICVRPSSVGRP